MNNKQFSFFLINWKWHLFKSLDPRSEESPDLVNQVVPVGPNNQWKHWQHSTQQSYSISGKGEWWQCSCSQREEHEYCPKEHLNHSGDSTNEKGRTSEGWVSIHNSGTGSNLRLLLAEPTYSWDHHSRLQCPVRHDYVHERLSCVFALVCLTSLQFVAPNHNCAFRYYVYLRSTNHWVISVLREPSKLPKLFKALKSLVVDSVILPLQSQIDWSVPNREGCQRGR